MKFENLTYTALVYTFILYNGFQPASAMKKRLVSSKSSKPLFASSLSSSSLEANQQSSSKLKSSKSSSSFKDTQKDSSTSKPSQGPAKLKSSQRSSSFKDTQQDSSSFKFSQGSSSFKDTQQDSSTSKSSQGPAKLKSSQGSSSFKDTQQDSSSFKSSQSSASFKFSQGSSSFKSTSPTTVGSSSFHSNSSLSSPDSFQSARCGCKGRGEFSNERISYVSVENPLIFLSGMDELPVLKDQNTEIRLEVQEPYHCGFCVSAMKKALQEIGDPDAVEEAKEQLISLLKGNKAFNVPYDNEAWLIRFLRIRDFKVEKAYELIQKYYIFKAKHKKLLFDDLVPESLKTIFKTEIFVVMPNRDKNGRRTIIFQARNWDLDAVKIEDILRVAILLGEASSYEPITQYMGVQFIIDMEGLSMKHLKEIGKMYAEIVMDYLQYSSPFKIERFHIVNETWLVKMVKGIFRLFTGDVVHGKALFHGDSWKKLHRHFRKEDLPSMYGGLCPLPQISEDEWNEILSCGSQEYNAINSYGVAIPYEEVDMKKKKEKKGAFAAAPSDSDR